MQEVIGTAMTGMLQNFQTEMLLPLLKEYGYEKINPGQWYSAEEWINFLKTVQNNTNGTTNLVVIGKAVVAGTVMPPGFENADFATILELWNDHYQANHRGDVQGGIEVERVDAKHYIITTTTPYPDNLEYGLAHGFARLALAKGQPYKVWYDEKTPRRDDGGDCTRIHISWA